MSLRKLTLAVIVLVCHQLYGAVAHVGSAANFSNGATSITKAYTIVNTNDIVIVMCQDAATTATMATPTGGAFTYGVANPTKTQAGGGIAGTWWAKTTSTGSTTFGCSASGVGNQFMCMFIDEWSGVDTTSPIDNHVEASNTTGAVSTSLVPVASNTGLYGAAIDSITGLGSGFSAGADDTQGDESEFKILSGGAGASQTINFTGSGTWILLGLSLAPPSGAVKRRRAEVISQ